MADTKTKRRKPPLAVEPVDGEADITRAPADRKKHGRRYRLFENGDVFVVEVLDDAKMQGIFHEPPPAVDGEPEPAPEAVQFFSIKEAERWVRQSKHRSGARLAVVTINRAYEIEEIREPRVVVRQRPKLGRRPTTQDLAREAQEEAEPTQPNEENEST
jgi:hypothetical protein